MKVLNKTRNFDKFSKKINNVNCNNKLNTFNQAA